MMQVLESKELCLDQQCTFHYSLNSQHLELEGQRYIGYGIAVEMTGSSDHPTRICIPDITSQYETARQLLERARSLKVSPMCLRMFVENYLEGHEV